ncbi:MAG TPA: TonB-dependent receptor [Terracidiphilus sp.]|nr:TonB-dependent receptor [Terracidiphilus sp.]
MRSLRLFALLLLCVCTVVSFAQTNTTGLSGTIIDPSGALISNASITLTNAATGLTKTTQSGEKGEYSFDQILPGTYTVTVEAPGFSNSVRKVTLLVATPLQLNIKMEMGVTEVVNVDASSSVINVSDASLGTPFSSQQVQTLPYQANNVLSLLSLQAGVLSLDPGAQNGGLNTDQRTGAINGARQDQSNVTLDGLDNNDQNNGYAFNGVLRSTRESVQEFRVTTENANADAGRSSGAQVSLVTRSGSNAIHGSAYYLYRGPATAGNSWFLKQSQLVKGQSNTAAKVLQDTFGASLGGPIIKNKLFFFGAYEGFKQASDVVVSQTVPSVLSPTTGLPTTSDSYGGLVTGTVTYKTSAGGLETLYPSDVMAMDKTGQGVDAAAVAYFNQYPRANSASLGDLYNTGGYVFSSPNPISQITNIARLDYNLSPKQILFVRGNLQSDNTTGTYQFLQSGQVPATRVYSNDKGVAAGWIWTLSNTATNNFRYGMTRQNVITLGAVNAGYVTISGLTSLYPSGTSANSSTYLEPVHDFVDDFTLVKGRHTIQFGINDRLLLNNRYTNASLFPTGSITVSLLTNAGVAGESGESFDPVTFGYPAVASSFRTSYNNAILADAGAITSSTQYLNYTLKSGTMTPIPSGQTLPTRHFRNFEQEYYVQDQWKVTPSMTLTAGVRYVYLQTPYETSGQQIAPTIGMDQFLTNRTTAAKSGGAYNTRITYAPAGKANNAPDYWTPQKGNFAPRVAIAWSPNGKYSVRAGYGFAFDHFGDSIVDAFDASGGFKLNSSTVNSYGSIDNSPRFAGYNAVPTRASSTTPITLPYTPPDNSFNFTSNINRDQKTPYAQAVNLTVEAEVRRGLTVTAGYVGRFGRHLLASWDASQPNNLYDSGSGMTYFQAMDQIAKMADQGVAVNAVSPMAYWEDMFPKATFTYKGTTYTGTQAIYAKEYLGDDVGNETDILYQYDVLTSGAADGSTYRFFFPQYGSMFAQSTIGTSSYNGGQLTVHQATRYGVQFDFNYTYSKSMDLGSYPERSGTSYNRISNTLNPAGNYGPSDFDVRHNITANWVANSPFGKGGLFFTSPGGLLERIIGGWQLTGVLHYSTGMPWTATSSVYGTNFAASSQLIATQPLKTTGHHRYVSSGTTSYETVFANDTPSSAYGKLRFVYPGEAGQRNNFRADGYFDMDSGLSKDFRTFHEQNLHIGVEAFNVLNSVRFNTLTTNATSGSFGKYSSLLVNPRQMQFTAKYTF